MGTLFEVIGDVVVTATTNTSMMTVVEENRHAPSSTGVIATRMLFQVAGSCLFVLQKITTTVIATEVDELTKTANLFLADAESTTATTSTASVVEGGQERGGGNSRRAAVAVVPLLVLHQLKVT